MLKCAVQEHLLSSLAIVFLSDDAGFSFLIDYLTGFFGVLTEVPIFCIELQFVTN